MSNRPSASEQFKASREAREALKLIERDLTTVEENLTEVQKLARDWASKRSLLAGDVAWRMLAARLGSLASEAYQALAAVQDGHYGSGKND